MKYHLQELDIRKVETTLFDNVISTKIDKNAFIDLKKEVFLQNNNLNVQIAETSAKIDLIKRD
jgi:hypothetical protein